MILDYIRNDHEAISKASLEDNRSISSVLSNPSEKGAETSSS
jgi:hypothetical protein